ncbi:MAG: Transcriptional regulator [Myxococcaceae bacterium]|nr:Transcriptional regulator [Myxococcaceae bacterium]
MVTKAKVPDRRVARTQRLLREALLSLILEKGWDEVSVQDVCERADVGRSTFYVHFGDKEELLLSGFDFFQRDLLQQVAAAGAKPLAFVRPLVEHVRDHHKLFRALVGKRSGQVVQKRFLAVLVNLLDSDLGESVPSGLRRTAAVRYAAGALSESLIWWLDSKARLDTEEITDVLQQLTSGLLAAAKRWR